MSYAVIKTGGKQIKAIAGERIWVEKLDLKEGEEIVLDEVLAYHDGSKLNIGKPFLDNVKVVGVVEKQGKGPKIIILRTKQKSNWKRKQGHRQPYTRILVKEIK